ncbi:hypothetical protein LSH36_562g01021 [Paralvinella palmiformis]|uniref:DNA-directed RNA polymerase I subunit RPA49 n=1 Tax=Paralvinella palmiformis TaxID=53620 RepID=A0AAD9MVF0_9ANNE|nr:hypothetical protein LSH36_562g01021 [Paralvinella palmiformis]
MKVNTYFMIAASFTNGQLIPEKADNFKFACYKYDGPKKSLKSKHLLVCENDQMQYVGHNVNVAGNSSNCRYMVAAYNKRLGKVHLYDSEVFQLHPKFEDNEEDDKDEVDMTYREKLDELTSAFGGVRGQRAMESRLKNKIQDESLDAAMTNVVADVLSRPDADSIIAKPKTEQNHDSIIPPYNPDAETPSDTYSLEASILYIVSSADVVSCGERTNSALVTFQYPSYILNHLAVLPLESNSRSHKTACLMYLCYMMQLFKMNVASLRKPRVFSEDTPKSIEKSLLDTFTIEAITSNKRTKSRCMPSRLKDKLLAYICVLCLILDEFSFDYRQIMVDLKISQKRLVQMLRNLGCTTKEQKVSSATGSDVIIGSAVLKVPLTFPTISLKKRKERR